jgi:hypothetical protein
MVSKINYMETERLLQEIVMGSFFICLGALLLLATRQRWRFCRPTGLLVVVFLTSHGKAVVR